MSDLDDSALRRIVCTADEAFRPYDRYGKPNPDLSWLPLSRDDDGEYEAFLIRFEPGGSSTLHEHTGTEEFLVLEGELEDSDGTVLRTGDFVSYPPGSRHSSVSPTGCILAVFLRGGTNRAIETD